MKKIKLLILFVLIAACNADENCLKSSGEAVSETFYTDAFHTIDIPQGVDVELVQADDFKVIIQSFKNRIKQIQPQVQDSVLRIENNNNCNLIHREKSAKITIHTPVLTTIKSRTQFRVFSTDTLKFPALFIISSLPENSASSEIDLILDNQSVSVEDNSVAFFKLSGKTAHLMVSLYGGSSAVDAKNLVADGVSFYHRSSNDIHLYPLNYIEGQLLSTGNAILYNKPDAVEISSTYKGKIEYRDLP